MIICISTITKLCSVYIKTEYEEYEENIENKDMIVSLPQIFCKLISDNDIDISKTQKIIISFGPGYFTGQRIGEAFAKGLLAGIDNASIIKLDSLEVFANSINRNGLIIPILRASRNTFNIAFFLKKQDVKRISNNLVLKKEQIENIKKGIILGEGILYLDNVNTEVYDKKYISGKDMYEYYKKGIYE